MAITSLRRDILLDKEMVLLPFFYFIKEKESKMTWIYLIFAGILEVVWATSMKLSENFSRLGYSMVTILGMILSFVFLARALKDLPMSLAYPIWTGIGAIGTVVVGIIFLKDQLSPLAYLFLILVVIGIIGLKMTSGH
ncbi:multidrug resistance protein, SMR family [Streptococcus gallolyticus subsp. gallolyticus TX20005]|nr:multidrug resistance protein, SMR family [Streptococcus gallolyticus subsp. gallolyticus TX20005]